MNNIQKMKKKLIFSIVVLLVVVFLGLTIYLISNRQTLFSRASGAPGCPSGTQLLFLPSNSLKVGSAVALNGIIVSVSDSPIMETRDGVPLVRFATSLKVTFPNNILLDSALIFDNDPKSGEKPWSINGISLPVTGGGIWGPLYKLNLTTNIMNFNNGGDSSHFNICVKSSTNPSPTPNPSNTPGPSQTPSPTNTNTPTPSPTAVPTLTPTPSACPLPETVTDVKITCPICSQ